MEMSDQPHEVYPKKTQLHSKEAFKVTAPGERDQEKIGQQGQNPSPG